MLPGRLLSVGQEMQGLPRRPLSRVVGFATRVCDAEPGVCRDEQSDQPANERDVGRLLHPLPYSRWYVDE